MIPRPPFAIIRGGHFAANIYFFAALCYRKSRMERTDPSMRGRR